MKTKAKTKRKSKSKNFAPRSKSPRKLRFAVVGVGHIAQAAVLPAFKHAKENCELVALVSGDKKKLKEVGAKYRVKNLYSYDEYDECLKSGLIDAVYIALPNDQHEEFAVRAAKAQIHVLCEKPIAVKANEAQAMIKAAADNNVKLMTAYRLHFQDANLEAIRIAAKELGEIRSFNSTFSMKVQDDNIRLNPVDQGGGPLYDIGIYCINASRYLFKEVPHEVFAFETQGNDPKFKDAPEMISAIMRYENGKIATFTCNYASVPVAWYEVLGTEGLLCLDNAYEYAGKMELEVMRANGKSKKRTFAKSDQFAPELIYFADCVLGDKPIEPDGTEGLIDVQIIEAMIESIETGRPVQLKAEKKEITPEPNQKMRKPANREPDIVRAEAPSAD